MVFTRRALLLLVHFLSALVVLIQAHGGCGTRNPSRAEKEKDMEAINLWKVRFEAKMNKLTGEGRRLQQENLGPYCDQCVNIKVWFYLLLDPAIPGGSLVPLTRDILHQQVAVTNQHFQGSPFRFTLLGIRTYENQVFASLDPDVSVNPGLSTEIGRVLRTGGRDVMNVFFSDGVCQTNKGFAALPTNWGIWPADTYDPDDTVFICTEDVYLVNGNGGTTFTHEAGHWLGLLHPFDDFGDFKGCDPLNLNDLVDDTPQMLNASYGCPLGRDSCPDLMGLDPINNYMDYSDDSCQSTFTQGQFERMYQEVDLYRRDLEPLGCNPETEATVYIEVLMDSDPDLKQFVIWDYVEERGVEGMGDPTLGDFANKLLNKTTCVLKHRPYDLTLLDESVLRTGLQPPAYYTMSVNGNEIIRGDEFDMFVYHAFSVDVTECRPNQQRFVLEIRYDCCPLDITWALRRDIDDDVVVNFDLLGTGAIIVASSLWVDRCLDPDTYNFVIVDSKGTGLVGSAYYRLLLGGVEMKVGGGDNGFKFTETFTFTVQESMVSDVPTVVPSLSPSQSQTQAETLPVTANPTVRESNQPVVSSPSPVAIRNPVAAPTSRAVPRTFPTLVSSLVGLFGWLLFFLN